MIHTTRIAPIDIDRTALIRRSDLACGILPGRVSAARFSNCRLRTADRNAKSHAVSAVFLGRPCARSVLSRPSLATTFSDHCSSPNGLPRFTLRRMASSSASVSAAFTWSIQPGRRGNGHADSNVFCLALPNFQRCRLFQRQSSARFTRFSSSQ